MSISISQVAAESDLIAELGSSAALGNITSDTFTAAEALALTLTDVLYELLNREPPVRESDISQPTELKRPVVLGTLARLYRNQITRGDGEDVASAKHKIFRDQYNATVSSLRPTVALGLAVAAPFGIVMHRR